MALSLQLRELATSEKAFFWELKAKEDKASLG